MILKGHRKGSLTVEAALVLPLFMTGLLTLVSSLYMCLLAQKIQASLLQTAQYLAISVSEDAHPDISEVRDLMAKRLSEEDYRFIENGKEGLDLSGSSCCVN